MILNFDDILNSSRQSDISWGYDKLNELCSLILKNNCCLGVDWDCPDENWATLKFDDDRQALICALVPISITNDKDIEKVLLQLAPEIDLVFVESFSQQFEVKNMVAIENIFGNYAVDRLKSLNQDTYSAGDIWWSTIT